MYVPKKVEYDCAMYDSAYNPPAVSSGSFQFANVNLKSVAYFSDNRETCEIFQSIIYCNISWLIITIGYEVEFIS